MANGSPAKAGLRAAEDEITDEPAMASTPSVVSFLAAMAEKRVRTRVKLMAISYGNGGIGAGEVAREIRTAR